MVGVEGPVARERLNRRRSRLASGSGRMTDGRAGRRQEHHGSCWCQGSGQHVSLRAAPQELRHLEMLCNRSNSWILIVSLSGSCRYRDCNALSTLGWKPRRWSRWTFQHLLDQNAADSFKCQRRFAPLTCRNLSDQNRQLSSGLRVDALRWNGCEQVVTSNSVKLELQPNISITTSIRHAESPSQQATSIPNPRSLREAPV